MSVDILKQQVLQALETGKDASQNVDTEANTGAMREAAADRIAKAVQTYVKTVLTQVIGSAIPVPQDGGAGLKSTMMTQINSI